MTDDLMVECALQITKSKILGQNSSTLWQQIIPIIQNNQRFIITSHVNPDCDALGSELALAEYLCDQGKQVTILNSDSIPAPYRFLDPQRIVKKYSLVKHAELIQAAEVIVVLDASGDWQRMGRVGRALSQTEAIKLCIDHHPDSTDFVDIAIIDLDAAATAELVYDFILTVNGSLSVKMAEAMYAAIITDSGSFRFPKTTPRTHRVAAALLTAGADPLYVYNQIYEQYSLNRVRLKGHVMDSIKTETNGQIAYYGLDQDTLKAYGVKVSELDGFASLGQEIGGVRVVIFCLQSSKNKVKISLRSDGSCTINQIATEYEGGGHPSAAGATVTGHLEEVMADVVQKAKQLLENCLNK